MRIIFHLEILLLCIISTGCSVSSKQIGALQSRPQAGPAEHYIVNGSLGNTIQENPAANSNSVISDVTLVSWDPVTPASLLSASDDYSSDPPPTETGVVVLAPPPQPVTSLRLQDVIDSVYASYPLLMAAYQSRSVADGDLLSTNGEFDLKLKGGGTSGPLGFYKTHRFGAGASQPLFMGGEIFGGYKIGRGNFQPWFKERQTNDGGEFSARIAIPLVQNRQIDARRAALLRASYGRDAVEPDIRTQIIVFVWEASYA